MLNRIMMLTKSNDVEQSNDTEQSRNIVVMKLTDMVLNREIMLSRVILS